jgi:Mg-chelatase subunit ChlD
MSPTVDMTDEQFKQWNTGQKTASEGTTTVHVTFVVDRSGSMQSIRDDVIGGFNSFLDDQRDGDGVCLLTLHQFDTDGIDTLHHARNVVEVPKAGPADFVPRGGTPLYDAIGYAIATAQVRQEGRTRDGAEAEKQLVVVLTDGMENSSREYTQEKVKALITAKEAEGWIFTFLGANIDSYAVGGGMGFSTAAVMDFAADPRGTQVAYANVSMATSGLRRATAGGQSVTSDTLYAGVGKLAEQDKKDRKK